MAELEQLRHLLALADCSSFRQATKGLHLSQPALTKSIQRLEKFYGVKLFDRLAKSVVPTPAGRIVIEKARELIPKFEAIAREIDLLNNLEGGSFIVGAGPLMAESFLGPAVANFIENHPKVFVKIKLGSWRKLIEALFREEIDFFLGDLTHFQIDSKLEIIKIPPQPFVWFCRPNHPLCQKVKISAMDLLKFSVIGPELPPWVVAWFQSVTAQKARANPERQFLSIQCEHYPLIKQIVQLNSSVSAAPKGIITNEVRQGVLVELPVEIPPMYSNAGIVFFRDRTSHPGAKLLINEILKLSGAVEEGMENATVTKIIESSAKSN
jgi:DNA-binding transcriptional LysR family regulator